MLRCPTRYLDEHEKMKSEKGCGDCSVTRLDDLLDFGQLFKAWGNN